MRDQHSDFRHISAKFTGQLILVDKGELYACRIKQNLMNHIISSLRVLDHSVKDDEERSNHDWQHDRVSSIEWIFLYQISKNHERNGEPHE